MCSSRNSTHHNSNVLSSHNRCDSAATNCSMHCWSCGEMEVNMIPQPLRNLFAPTELLDHFTTPLVVKNLSSPGRAKVRSATEPGVSFSVVWRKTPDWLILPRHTMYLRVSTDTTVGFSIGTLYDTRSLIFPAVRTILEKYVLLDKEQGYVNYSTLTILLQLLQRMLCDLYHTALFANRDVHR